MIFMNILTKGIVVGTALLALTGCGSTTPVSLTENQFRVTVTNVSQDSSFSDAVFMLHKSAATLNFKNEVAPPELASLAKKGDIDDFKTYLESLPDVASVVVVDGKLKPGVTKEFVVTLPEGDTDHTLFGISGATKLLGQDDTYIMINNIALPDDKDRIANGRNMDAGLITDGKELEQAEKVVVNESIDQTLLQVKVSKQ